VSLRFNAQADEIVANQPRVQTYIDPQLAWNSGYEMGLAQAYDIASGGRWNCTYACAGYPGGRLGEWQSTSEITVPSRQWLEQQTVDFKWDMTENVSFQYLFGHTWNDSRTYNDWDSGEFNFYIDYFNTETEVTSNEFQFTGGGDRINWVGGAYMWDQGVRARNPAWSMREWSDVPGYGEPQPFSYANQILPSPECQMTPAQRGITSWQPGIDAGYVPGFAAGLDVNSVNGWPFPCEATLSPYPNTGWVGALASGARPPAGDRLTGSDISGYALFGEVTIGLTEKFDVTLGYRYHDQEEDQLLRARVGPLAAKPLQTNKEWQSGGVYDGRLISSRITSHSTPIRIGSTVAGTLTDNVMLQCRLHLRASTRAASINTLTVSVRSRSRSRLKRSRTTRSACAAIFSTGVYASTRRTS
jgi:hypothetical protein